MIKRFNEFVNESSFAKLKSILSGYNNNVNTIGIMTAENPLAEEPIPHPTARDIKQYSATINNQLNTALEYMLKKLNLQFMRIKGKYGNDEDSYIIINISKQEIQRLGKIFKQESVIWGEKVYEHDFPHFKFHFLQEGNEPITRNISITSPEIQNRDDFFSSFKGRKFYIPFFDDDKKPKSLGKFE